MHGLFTKDGKDAAFSRLLEEILNQVLQVQSEEQLGAAPYERTSNRSAYRTGKSYFDMTEYFEWKAEQKAATQNTPLNKISLHKAEEPRIEFTH